MDKIVYVPKRVGDSMKREELTIVEQGLKKAKYPPSNTRLRRAQGTQVAGLRASGNHTTPPLYPTILRTIAGQNSL